MKEKKVVDPIANYLQSAQNIFTDFADLWDEESVAPLKQELERLQNIFSSQQSEMFQEVGENSLKIAVVGPFSCGKSSFINSILGENIAPTDIKPSTHGVTQFVYGEEESIRVGDGENAELISRELYTEYILNVKNDVRKFVITYPCENLKKLVFIDSPGFQSVSSEVDAKTAEIDNQLSAKTVQEADAIFFLHKVTDEGIIPHDELLQLKQICLSKDNATNLNRKIYFIFTHCDKRSPEKREIIFNAVKSLCHNENLNITDFILYSSWPIEKMKMEKEREFFSKAREELFSTVRNLQLIGSELISYRKGFDNLVFNLHLRQFLERIHSEIPALKKKLGTTAHLKKQLMDKVGLFTQETINYVCEIFEDKFAANRTSLIYDEKHTLSDDIISVVKCGDFVTLSDGEVYSIAKELQKNAERNGFVLDSIIEGELSIFLSAETASRSEPSGLYRQISRYPNNGYFAVGSLADAYLKTCVSLLNTAGGPWEEYLYESDRGPFINKKLQHIKAIFDRNFRDKVSDAFYSQYFLAIIEKSIIDPQISALEKRIKNLSTLEKSLVYKAEVPKKKEDKKESTEEVTKNLSADDIFDML